MRPPPFGRVMGLISVTVVGVVSFPDLVLPFALRSVLAHVVVRIFSEGQVNSPLRFVDVVYGATSASDHHIDFPSTILVETKRLVVVVASHLVWGGYFEVWIGRGC